MFQDPKSDFEYLGLLVTIGVAVGFYSFLSSRSGLEKRHATLREFFTWLGRDPWLDAVQGAVKWVLRGMDRIYGRPKGSGPHSLGDFFTLRSWKISAWLACFILFALPLLILVVGLPFDAMARGNPFPWEAIVPCGVLLGLFVWIGATALKGILVRSSPKTLAQRCDELVRGGLRALGFLILPAIVILVAMAVASMPDVRTSSYATFLGILLLVGLGGLFAAVFYLIVSAIRSYGFLAPVAISLQLVVACSFAIVISYPTSAMLDYAFGFSSNRSWSALIGTLPATAAALFSIWLSFRKNVADGRLAVIAVSSIAYEILLISILPGS